MRRTGQLSRETREDAHSGNIGERNSALTTRACSLDKVCRSHRKQRRGAAVVEFAVVAPVFLLLIFGMVEYGRMMMVQQVLTNASREGARRAVLDGTTTTEVVNAVTDYLTSASITANDLDITVDPNPPNSAAFGEPVTVTVSVPFDQVSWLPSPMFLGGTEMSATTVMRRESVQ